MTTPTWPDSWLTADEARAAVPATPERRDLDRAHPARALTVTEPDGRVFWVITGAVEYLADSAAHQRLVISNHNANRNLSADDLIFEHYRSIS
jgi:hypothetical protein